MSEAAKLLAVAVQVGFTLFRKPILDRAADDRLVQP